MATLRNTTIIDCTIRGEMSMEDATIHINSDEPNHIVIGAEGHIFEVLQEDETSLADVRGRNAYFDNINFSSGESLPTDLGGGDTSDGSFDIIYGENITGGSAISMNEDGTGEVVRTKSEVSLDQPPVSTSVIIGGYGHHSSVLMNETAGIIASVYNGEVQLFPISYDPETGDALVGSSTSTFVWDPKDKVTISRIDDHHFIVGISLSGSITYALGEIDNNQISIGSFYTFNQGELHHDITIIDDQHFVLTYQSLQTDLRAIVGTYTIGDLTADLSPSGATLLSSTVRPARIRTKKVGAKRVICSFKDENNNKYGSVIVFQIDLNSFILTSGPVYVFLSQDLSGVTYNSDLSMLDTTNGVLCYRKTTSNGYRGRMRVFHISGTTISFDDEVPIAPFSELTSIQSIGVSGDMVALIYNINEASAERVFLQLVDLNDQPVSFGNPTELSVSSYYKVNQLTIDGNFSSFICGYMTENNYPMARMGSFGGTTNVNRFIGFAKESGVAGETKPIYPLGTIFSDGQSLSPGQTYYLTEDGFLTLERTDWMAGYALTTTQLLVWR